MKIEKSQNKILNSISRGFKTNPISGFMLFGLVIASIGILPHFGLIEFGTMGTFAYIVIYTVVALGLNILLGFSGLISLGTAGFVGAGALGTAVFLELGLPFEVAVLLVLLIAGLFGAVIGLFSLKVEGIYLAIATLFVGEILRQIYTQVKIFGGNNKVVRSGEEPGVELLGRFRLTNFLQDDRSTLFIIITVLMTITMILMYNIVKSRTGRALMAMSRSQHAAQAMGVSILKYRLTAFILATMYATFGGVMFALYFQNVSTTEWTLELSLIIIGMVVVGGFKSIYGTFLGAFIIHGVPNLWLNNILGDVSYIFTGVLIIIVIIFYPNGFVYIGHDMRKAFYKIKNFDYKKANLNKKTKQVSDDE
ncbi:branched-chain amino acid ABC transporter permease [Haloplasma contractile]|uniref:Branched-chain amino acid ABC transport permease protein n=1 Tax=Haloplasma contractile SSD-17B TaxID=1033810 RepID=U2FFY8_9MOLU|nr:branched-chain amino acid ABC transporter permease [Haloplasma contractile]ERJ11815.1 Putative branched-chain amino acid ABC transport permease protein [Haloplasma contractile SSD-17B]